MVAEGHKEATIDGDNGDEDFEVDGVVFLDRKDGAGNPFH